MADPYQLQTKTRSHFSVWFGNFDSGGAVVVVEAAVAASLMDPTNHRALAASPVRAVEKGLEEPESVVD